MHIITLMCIWNNAYLQYICKYVLLQIRIIANTHYCKYALLWPRQFTFEHFRLSTLSLNSELSHWKLSLRLFPVWFALNIRNRPYYHPQTKLPESNVFTSMCQEFCPRGVYTRLGRHPSLGRHPLGRHPPPADTALDRHPPRADTRSPPGRRLLQWTVCILLECILVTMASCLLTWRGNRIFLSINHPGAHAWAPLVWALCSSAKVDNLAPCEAHISWASE